MITSKATTKPYTVKIHIAGDHKIAVENICKNYCTKVGLCVTVTQTNYIYKNGSEPGFTIGLINYPRFPETPDQIINHAEKLAFDLAIVLDQMSYTIETPDMMYYHYDQEKKPMPDSTRVFQSTEPEPESKLQNTNLSHKTEEWLESNQIAPKDVRWGTFPLGMVQRWIERAENAETKLAKLQEESQKALLWLERETPPQYSGIDNDGIPVEYEPTAAEFACGMTAMLLRKALHEK